MTERFSVLFGRKTSIDPPKNYLALTSEGKHCLKSGKYIFPERILNGNHTFFYKINGMYI